MYIRSSATSRAPLHEQFDINDGSHASFYTGAGTKNLVEYLEWNYIDNIIIYIEDGEIFDGVFDFDDRGSRTVYITTDPTEITDRGNASIVYSPTLINDASVTGGVTFENLKIYSDDLTPGSFIILQTSSTTLLTFINCIVQINKEAVTSCPTCVIKVINSMLLFFNKEDSASLYLSNSTLTGHQLINSLILTESADAETFQMDSTALTDYINNCISYNYGAGTFAINAPGRKLLCQENVDPELSEIEANWVAEDQSVIMTQSDFIPLLTSPVADAGNSSLISSYNIDTDIIGNDRTFGFGYIDIGPYEIEIHILDITGSDIQSINQVKCEIDRINRRVVSIGEDQVYTGLFNSFKNDYGSLEEFIREENITIKLKQNEPTISLKTDKPYDLLATFDANYDSPTGTILVKKIPGDMSRKLGQMLESDLYVLHFNEQESKLYMYLNKVATLGLNGSRNPIKNVQFGGNPTFSG